MTISKVQWMGFRVVEENGHKYFRHGNDVRQACMLADNFWREAGSNDVVLLRDGEQFDTGAVTTTDRTRHFTGVTKFVPEPSARQPADMWGEFLTRLCADWFYVGDVLRVHYDPSLFFLRKRNLEALAFLK
jgi:hypothetical protein